MAACLEEEEEEGFTGLGGDLETMASCVEEEAGFFMPPFLYEDEEETALLEAVDAELLRREAEEARKEEERRRRGAVHQAVLDSILERDPKTGREVYTRYSFTDFSIFDIDEESLIPPMRFTNTGYIRGLTLEDSANIHSVKIVSSDRGFPINVYGTIIARDIVDHKCIYIFNRHRENCQTINSEEESLILTGPDRGLVLLDFVYIEMNLKIKVDEEPHDQQISKGLLGSDGRVQPRDEKINVGSQTLKSWLSFVEVRYATILNAVEGTFEIELLEGHFCGKIKASIEGIEDKVVIHNSEEDGLVTSGDRTIMKLQCRVLTIFLGKMLTFELTSKGCNLRGCVGAPDSTSERSVEFPPQRRGQEVAEVSCGFGKLLVKVVWSLMDILGRSSY
uniref:Uncharacterized protein n=2 Tax=Avena sativa TaxID=4498 RepID=A0ACD5WEA9_AVESA